MKISSAKGSEKTLPRGSLRGPLPPDPTTRRVRNKMIFKMCFHRDSTSYCGPTSDSTNFWILNLSVRNHKFKVLQIAVLDLKKHFQSCSLCSVLTWVQNHWFQCTLFENHRKSLIQHCERSELRLHFEWTKLH